MKSINRFIANNFDDDFKQEGLDMILGKHRLCVPRGIRYEVEKELVKHESEYQTRTIFRTLAVTWNVGGNNPADLKTDLYKMGLLNREDVQSA